MRGCARHTHTRDCYLERAFRAEREAPATPPVGHEQRGHHHHLLKQTRETSSPKPGNACLRPCGKGRRRERRAAPWKRSARGASKSRAPFRALAVQTQPLRPPHPAPPPPLPLSEAAGACRLDLKKKKKKALRNRELAVRVSIKRYSKDVFLGACVLRGKPIKAKEGNAVMDERGCVARETRSGRLSWTARRPQRGGGRARPAQPLRCGTRLLWDAFPLGRVSSGTPGKLAGGPGRPQVAHQPGPQGRRLPAAPACALSRPPSDSPSRTAPAPRSCGAGPLDREQAHRFCFLM